MPTDPKLRILLQSPSGFLGSEGKHIQFECKTVNMLLKMKFREYNCDYLMPKTIFMTRWPYIAILNHLALEGRTWQPTSTLIPRKIALVDLDEVPKVWIYFLHHTLDTNWSGSELVTMRVLALYLMLT